MHVDLAQLRNRPRGLGLLQLPTGVPDEKTGPFTPNLYIAGDKPSLKPQTIPKFHLPGQRANFSGSNGNVACMVQGTYFFRSSFNPFTHAVSAVYHEDLDARPECQSKLRCLCRPSARTNDWHQPFIQGFAVGNSLDTS